LTAVQARTLHLAAQGLCTPPKRKAKRADVSAAIRRMLVLQIDTINVVNRSPLLVLFSRLGAFDPAWLFDLLQQRKLFELWAHEACFAPSEDYDLLHTYNAAHRHLGKNGAHRTLAKNKRAMQALLDHVRAHGPVTSSDFAREKGSGGWWGWSDEKRFLEAWFALGELMVARRDGFQRVYDLKERVRPMPRAHIEDYAQLLTERSIRALGITQASWINDYYRTKPRLREPDLVELLEDGKVRRVTVDGWDAPAYMHADNMQLARSIAKGTLQATHTTLLSPFDPVVWDRKRALAMFNFDYRIECYTPAPKRKYGYFVLPILSRGQLVGRLDAKAHRSEGVFEVKALHLETGVKPNATLAKDIANALQASATWHGTPEVVLPSGSAGIARLIRAISR
jgi:uncharacterized protein